MQRSPRSILADAGPLVAILRPDDPHHDRARSFIRGYTGSFVTVWPVLAEASHLVSRQGNSGLLDRYETMDLADAALVAISERSNVLDVITVDRRDFAVYRTRTGRAFTNHFPKPT